MYVFRDPCDPTRVSSPARPRGACRLPPRSPGCDAQPHMPDVETQTNDELRIKLVSNHGKETLFIVKPSTKLGRVMRAYCTRLNLRMDATRFIFDGNRLNEGLRVSQSGLKYDDIIDVQEPPSLSRAPMDPLAALLSERPPQQLSVTELRARIALLEDAARAYRAELESRTARLDALPDEIQQVIFGQLCDVPMGKLIATLRPPFGPATTRPRPGCLPR